MVGQHNYFFAHPEADTPLFSRSGDIFFVREERGADYVFRMREDGTELRKVIPDRVGHLISLSPDGRWIIAATETGEPRNPQIVVGKNIEYTEDTDSTRFKLKPLEIWRNSLWEPSFRKSITLLS